MLLDYWGDENRVIDVGLTVTYKREKVWGKWDYFEGVTVLTLPTMWKYTRVATKTYRYVGMDKATAKACAEEMAENYTRETMLSLWQESGDETGTWKDVVGGRVLMTSISTVNKNASEMYDVEIQVHEQDEKWDIVEMAPKAKFGFEDARSYDY